MSGEVYTTYDKAVIKCACGNVIETRSTKQNISVEVCSKCHPFYTGQQRRDKADGRLGRFKKRLAHSQG